MIITAGKLRELISDVENDELLHITAHSITIKKELFKSDTSHLGRPTAPKKYESYEEKKHAFLEAINGSYEYEILNNTGGKND